ncbi:MAG: gamma-glutamylcyclotransferase [Phycisphaeraceae bacterium]|nr:gamma-glutamylcyclotransferase [Phycisphaeraceae bacterium]
MPSEPALLFIYGTLKRGGVRAPLLEGQRFVGEARTLERYRLFNTGDYPALIEAKALTRPGRSIIGELWEVSPACLKRLDIEEGVDEGLYARRRVELMADDMSAQAYFYLHPVDGMQDCGDCWEATC